MRMKPENYMRVSPAAKKLYDNPKFEFEIVTSGENAGKMGIYGWKKTMKRPEPAVLDEIKTILLEEKAERDATRDLPFFIRSSQGIAAFVVSRSSCNSPSVST